MAVRKQASAPKIREPYASMIVRVHELCLAVLGQAQEGNATGVMVEAERLAAQAGALAELLRMRK